MLLFSCRLQPEMEWWQEGLDPTKKLSAGSLYLVADKMAGGPKALAHYQVKPLPVPLFGPALGATTAMLVPYTYPFCQGLAAPSCVFGERLEPHLPLGEMLRWPYHVFDFHCSSDAPSLLRAGAQVSTHPLVASCLSFTGGLVKLQ